MDRLLRSSLIASLAVLGLMAPLAMPATSAGPTPGAAALRPNPGEGGPAAQVPPSEPITLTILHTNDVHSHVDEWVSGGITYGGAARLATAIERVRNTAENVLLLDAGDQFQGTLFYTVFKADVLTATMNALGYDAMVVGNHEFDDGDDELARFIGGADFPVLAANIEVLAGDSPLAGLLAPTTVVTLSDQPIGIIGLTTPDTPILSSPSSDIDFLDPVETARQAVEDLAARGIDKIIALTHLGYTADLKLAREVPGLDVIVGGHSHTYLATPPENAAGPYPTVYVSPGGEPTLVVTAGEWGKYLGKLTVRFDSDGIVEYFDFGSPILLDGSVPKDPELEALVATYREPLEAFRNQVIGESAIDIPIREGNDLVCRIGECLAGNLVADAIRYYAESTDWTNSYIAIMNGGGLRAPIDAGPITVGEVLELLPFGNTVATFAITGTYIIEALENGVSKYPEQSGRFPQVSGLRFEWHPDQPPGKRIASVQVWNWDWEGYVPLDPDEVYWVATNDFLRRGGDGYTMFRDHAITPYDFGPPLDQVLIDYIRGRESAIEPKLGDRIAIARWRAYLPLALVNSQWAIAPPMGSEEYAILRAVIEDWYPAHPPSTLERYVIYNETDLPGLLWEPDEDPFEYLSKNLSGLTWASWGDWLFRNGTQARLENRFGLPLPVVLLGEAELEELFGGEGDGWQRFRERYPNAQGLMRFSRPGIRPDGEQALVYVSNAWDYLAAEGYMMLLTRDGEGWRVSAKVLLWIS